MKIWKKIPVLFFYILLLAASLASTPLPEGVQLQVGAGTTCAVSPGNVQFSEVAWEGTSILEDDWLELHNTTANAVALDGCQLFIGSKPYSLGTFIPGNGYYLIEMNDDNTISDIKADLIISSGLNDGGADLSLKNETGAVTIDSIQASTGWPAGGVGASMERDSGGNWVTHSGPGNGKDANGIDIKGTPHNSQVDLSMSVGVDNPAPALNGNVKFTITLKNNGIGNPANIIVKNEMPSGLIFVSANPEPGTTYDSGTGNWSVPTLVEGEDVMLEITAKVQGIGVKTFKASITGSSQGDPDLTNNAKSIDVQVPTTDLELDLKADNTAPLVNESVTFTITVSNKSTLDATGVSVQAALPAGFEYQSHTPAGDSYTDTDGIWTIGTLAKNSERKLSITARVKTSGSTFRAQVWECNEADLDSTPGNSNPSEDDDDSILLLKSADIEVKQTVNNQSPGIGDSIVFTVTVKNLGPDSASNILVEDAIPNGWKYLSATETVDVSDITKIKWTISSLLANESQSIKITIKVNQNQGANKVSVVLPADVADPILGNNTKTLTLSPSGGIANLKLEQSAPVRSTTNPGQVTLKITVTNLSTSSSHSDATNVIVKDDLPEGLSYVSHFDTGGGSYDKDTGLWQVGALAKNGGTRTLTIIARVNKTNSRTNVAEIWRADQGPADPSVIYGDGNKQGNELDSRTVYSADLSLNMVMNKIDLTLNEDVVFTLRVTNDGPDDVDTVQVMDMLPSGYQFKSASGNYANGIWTVGSLNKNETRELNITATVTSTNYSYLQNTAEIVTSSRGGTDVIDIDSIPYNYSRDSDDDASAPSADLRLEMSVDPQYPSQDNPVITFTIKVTNDGVLDATGVRINDKPPVGIIYEKNTCMPTDICSVSTGSEIIWNLGTVKVGTPVTLTFKAKVNASGTFTNWAEVKNSTLPDPDSVPGNASTTEDDDADATVTLRPVIINEVAWAGTAEDLPKDQWIELYNPSAAAMNITGWNLVSKSGKLDIVLSGSIPAGGYFLLERDDDETVLDIKASQIYKGDKSELSKNGETLMLYTNITHEVLIDTANGDGGPWPQGGEKEKNYATMERKDANLEKDLSWVTNTGVTRNGKNSVGNPIYGTPGAKNSTGIPPTPVPPQPTPEPVGRPILNEYLPRAGYDWNQDGRVDVQDEFIEIKNVGFADVNLSGWQLDDEEQGGSESFILPDLTLKPGDRYIFFGKTTGILLGDGGDTVRLIDTNGEVKDAQTYNLVKKEDQSFCRLPDGSGIWYQDCIPTPNLANSKEGQIPVMPGGGAYESPTCNLPDTLPIDFLIAECRGYGADIWNSAFWDQSIWHGVQFIRGAFGKWTSFVE